MQLFQKPVELLLTSFGAHLPGGPGEFQEVNVFPVSIAQGTHLDLDFSSLLLIDRLVLDSNAYEYICGRRHLWHMQSSIDRLLDADLLRLQDYAVPARQLHSKIEPWVTEQLTDLDRWRDCAQQQWKLFQPMIPKLLPALGEAADPEIENLHFGIYCFLKKKYGKIDKGEAQPLLGLLNSRRSRLLKEDKETLREIIRPLLTYVALNYGLMGHFDMPFIDWSDLAPYYRAIDSTRPPAPVKKGEKSKVTNLEIEQTRSLFSVVVPELQPGSVDAFIKFVRTRGAVKSLRSAVREAIETGTALDSRWISAVRDDIIKAQETAIQRERIIKLLGLPIGPVASAALTGASELIKMGTELARTLSEEAVGEIVERKSLRAYQWYFALLALKS